MEDFFEYDKDLHDRIVKAAKGALSELRMKEECRAELQMLTNDKFKAQAIAELLPESEVVYEAVKGALMRGMDTEYVLNILNKHKING